MNTSTILPNTFDVVDDPRRFTNLYHFQLELDKYYEKEIYVDSSDFISLILGINDFYSSYEKVQPEFDLNKFGHKMTMLHSLMYHQYLGKLRLLNPHMFEFLEINLSQNFKFNKTLKIEDGASIITRFDLINISAEKLKGKKIEEVLPFNQIEGEAETRFKLMYLIRDDHPKKRTTNLLNSAIISFETDPNFSVADFTGTKLFKRILSILNEVNESKNINNFHDALALCQLQAKLVKNLKPENKLNDKTCIPLLYVHNKVLEAVRRVSEDVDMLEDGIAPFTFYGETGRHLIVQDEDFFILDALFNVRAGEMVKQFTFEEFFQEIQEFYNSLNKDDTLKRQLLDNDIEFLQKQELKKSFKRKVQLEFFRKWWEDSDGEKDLKTSLEKLNDYDAAYLDKSNFEYVEQAFEQSFKEVEKKAMQQNLSLKYAKITFRKKFMESINAKHNDAGALKYDLDQEFITRFSYPMESIMAIRNFIQRLYDSFKDNHHDTNEDLKVEMITYLQYVMDYNVLRTDRSWDQNSKLEKLCVMLSILWMEGEYTLLNQFCDAINNTMRTSESEGDAYPNYQIGLLHATSLIQQSSTEGIDYVKISEILSCIDKKFADDSYKCWLGQSFVYSKLWESVDSKISIPEIMALKPLSTTDEQKRRGYYQHSKSLALDAFKEVTDVLRDDTKRDDEKKHVRERRYYYSMNLYIYMETLNRQLEAFPGDLAKMVRDLEGLTNSNLQHERYYDTLARYYQRMAAKMALESPESQDKYDGYLTNAMHFVENAIQSARENNNRTDIDLYEPLRNELASMRLEGVLYFNN